MANSDWAKELKWVAEPAQPVETVWVESWIEFQPRLGEPVQNTWQFYSKNNWNAGGLGWQFVSSVSLHHYPLVTAADMKFRWRKPKGSK